MTLRLALNHQTAKLVAHGGLRQSGLRLALNHQTAKLVENALTCFASLRLALNHQTAKLDLELRPWKQGLFSLFE